MFTQRQSPTRLRVMGVLSKGFFLMLSEHSSISSVPSTSLQDGQYTFPRSLEDADAPVCMECVEAPRVGEVVRP